jgi:hypothetical protein
LVKSVGTRLCSRTLGKGMGHRRGREICARPVSFRSDPGGSDVARAKAWYAEKLGLYPTAEVPGGLIFPAGGRPVGFLVYLSPNAGTNKATCAAWIVDDLPGVMTALRGRGVTFLDYDTAEVVTVDGIGTTGDGTRTTWLVDSEGNTLSITQLPPGPAPQE